MKLIFCLSSPAISSPCQISFCTVKGTLSKVNRFLLKNDFLKKRQLKTVACNFAVRSTENMLRRYAHGKQNRIQTKN